MFGSVNKNPERCWHVHRNPFFSLKEANSIATEIQVNNTIPRILVRIIHIIYWQDTASSQSLIMASFDLSHAQVVALTLAPIVPGLLSFAASGTIVAMILRSPGKLSKPFRRIIFGISAYDVIQSFTASLSGFPSPSGSRWAAIGNDSTCTVQGFFSQVSHWSLGFESLIFLLTIQFAHILPRLLIRKLGVSGSPLYSLSLAIYYLCVIKFNMTDDQFQKRVEVYLHAVSNALVWFSSIFLLVRGYFNVTIANCWISPYPSDCIHNPDVDCIRG